MVLWKMIYWGIFIATWCARSDLPPVHALTFLLSLRLIFPILQPYSTSPEFSVVNKLKEGTMTASRAPFLPLPFLPVSRPSSPFGARLLTVYRLPVGRVNLIYWACVGALGVIVVLYLMIKQDMGL
jgi:hypothetical protein